jgi:primosomal protein N' (replication factor Y)
MVSSAPGLSGAAASSAAVAECVLQVATLSPLSEPLSYASPAGSLPPGTLVRVPLGPRRIAGVVLGPAAPVAPDAARPLKLKPIGAVFECLPPLADEWLQLARFAADYYLRPLGEFVAQALPRTLAEAEPERIERLLDRLFAPSWRVRDADAHAALLASIAPRHAALRRLAQALGEQALSPQAARALHPQAPRLLERWWQAGWLELLPAAGSTADVSDIEPAKAPVFHGPSATETIDATVTLSQQQRQALAALPLAPREQGAAAAPQPVLLWGATGSGKTEVYLRACARVLAADARAQVLVLVPEINLTPQLEALFRRRFAGQRLVTLHSGLADGERLAHWLLAHLGEARIVLGTRMAVLASLPRLALVIVDEEHDPSYKAQDGARHSARDLAVYRAHRLGIPIVLGSATPALESWRAALAGRYRRVDMPERISRAPLPRLVFSDPRQSPKGALLTPAICAAIEQRIARGEQALVFLNRRGYAPVIGCQACGWLSDCPHCSAWRVFHKSDRSLRCHHCGHHSRVPAACPRCGDLDLRALGSGTQKLEEWLQTRFAQARIARIDADSTRRKGSAAAAFAEVHAGAVDILVGTQMITKGHDFQRVSLVVAANVDAGLFAADFRASERLFAQLMQAAGRAGRAGLESEFWLQTAYPQHPLFAALRAHDYAGFAAHALAEREQAGLPPYVYLALLRAEARSQQTAQDFLQQARALAAELLAESGDAAASVTLYPPVPMSLQRVANVERAQMLLEAARRAPLQRLLHALLPRLRALRLPTGLRFAIDVDPVEI